MNQKFKILFSIAFCVALVFPPETSAHGPLSVLHWGTKGVLAGIHKSASVGRAAAKGVGHGIAKAAWLPVLGTKKALLLAPITVPLALGGKALLAGALAVPIGVGAAIGAPVGALIGAKAGAIKGALVGKALIAAKLGLVKKKVLLLAGAKAKLTAFKLGLIGKKAVAVGALAVKAGASIKAASAKLHGLTSFSALPALALPSLPALPVAGATSKSKGPTSLEYSLVVNGPHTGYKAKKASFYSNRRKRDAEAEAEPEPAQANAQQLLQLVRSQNAQQCLQRVICELSANPNSHGNDGIRFGRSLILLESQTDRTSASQYRQAANTGSQVASERSCQQFYPTCAFQSNEIIRIGNQMIGG